MRLGQLARKLSIRTGEIVEFLATQNITIEAGTNVRVDDTHVLLVVDRFAPELKNEILKTELEEAAEPESTPVATITQEPMIPTEPQQHEEAEQPEEPIAVADSSEVKPEIEVIKAPKVELSGLKVLGKIELPEPRKKEVKEGETPPAAEGAEPPPSRERRKPMQRRDDQRAQRSNKNPIAAQREREEAEAKKRRQEELKKQKEKKTQHYYSKVRVAPATRKSKRGEEHEELTDTTPSKPQPTSLWGKFKRWLTS